MFHVFVGYLLSKTKDEAENEDATKKMGKLEKIIAKITMMKKKRTPIEDGLIKISIKTVR